MSIATHTPPWFHSWDRTQNPNSSLEYEPRLKSVSPFEHGEPDLQWAIPTFSMPHIPEEVVSEGSHSVRSASPLQRASTSKKGKSTPGQEGPKTPKGATKKGLAQILLPTTLGRSSNRSFPPFGSVRKASFPPGVALGVNDIFYHVISSTGKAQLWLWSGSAWLTVKVGEMRTFEDREYALTIFHGRNHPGWVTMEVFQRYHSEGL
ncbi:hypothetical protein BDN71DRAFT_1431709 [Pleurotus eryngii]|uniref:Uncharacterized protein n=1 Tax=Pleurotus eryngii TaxID=5323 RepID=A0A9P5ZU10_PLEER|nr:hypothetical protein BDN71DRAFT_1431709 [Pleurotus eryngii]